MSTNTLCLGVLGALLWFLIAGLVEALLLSRSPRTFSRRRRP